MPGGLYVCRTADYSLKTLSSRFRTQVRRAMQLCEIRSVAPDELLREGYQLNLQTMERQHRYDPEFGDTRRWNNLVKAIELSPFVAVTGAFVGGRLSAYTISCRENDWLHLLYKMSRAEDRHLDVGHALDYAVVAGAGPEIRYVGNSYNSVLPNPGLDQYKQRMGFSISPRNMAIHFHPAISPLVTNRVSVAFLNRAWRQRPQSARLELAAKLLDGARITMTEPFPILTSPAGAVDPCQHSGCLTYSRMWKPHIFFLARSAMAYARKNGPIAAAAKAARSVVERLKPPPKGRIAFKPMLPGEQLDLQVGEWVEVRSEEEINATIDSQGKTRGLAFVALEMAPHVGKRYRVYKRVEKIFLEESKQNRKLKNTVLLDGVQCQGIGLDCDRCCYLFWREAWLKRVDGPNGKIEVTR